MSRPGGETELRPPDAQPGDHVGSLCQDLAGEASLLDARPPQQLPERPPPISPHGDLELLREQLDDPSGGRIPAESDPDARDSRLR